MRANGVVKRTRCNLRSPTDEPAPRTLLPISRRSRLATDITVGAGRLLPDRFTPYRSRTRRDYSLLPSCVTDRLLSQCPRLLFREAAFRLAAGGESGSSSGANPSGGTSCVGAICSIAYGGRGCDGRPGEASKVTSGIRGSILYRCPSLSRQPNRLRIAKLLLQLGQ